MRGRKPKPTKLKLLQGNPGKRPLNKKEPVYKNKIPRCPAWLDTCGKYEWRRISKELDKNGLVCEVYKMPLALYCQAYSLFRNAEKQVRKEGITIMTSNGNVLQHPAVGVMNKAAERLLKIAVEFGMTPSAKSRIKTDIKTSIVDPFEKLLNRVKHAG